MDDYNFLDGNSNYDLDISQVEEHLPMSDDSNFLHDDSCFNVQELCSTDNIDVSDSPLEHHVDISFAGKYSPDEIKVLEHNVDSAKYEMHCREIDMHNWETKVSLNNTNEHKLNGDYDNALSHFKEATSRYNNAVYHYNSAVSKLNNVR